MDLRKLKTLIDLVAESGIAELEITEGEGKVRIVKHTAPAPATYLPQPAVAMAAAPMQAAPTAAAPVAQAVPAAAAPAEPAAPAGQVIKSPMVGTFYRSANPNSAPFVDVGSAVKAGDTLCIIEAMKLMNEIDAPSSGKVVKILGVEGKVVEFGEVLFLIDPSV